LIMLTTQKTARSVILVVAVTTPPEEYASLTVLPTQPRGRMDVERGNESSLTSLVIKGVVSLTLRQDF